MAACMGRQGVRQSEGLPWYRPVYVVCAKCTGGSMEVVGTAQVSSLMRRGQCHEAGMYQKRSAYRDRVSRRTGEAQEGDRSERGQRMRTYFPSQERLLQE